MWDRSSPFTGKGDPGRVLGAFTVDGFDERSQTFADAARQLREEADWEYVLAGLISFWLRTSVTS